jgi:hypothetical protein
MNHQKALYRETKDRRRERREISICNQTALVVSMLGICDDLKANKTRRDKIMSGTKRRIKGGGGNGGSTSGRTRIEIVNTTITMIKQLVLQ